MAAADAEAALARLAHAASLAEVAAADLVIEAVFENFELKARLFEELGLHVAPTTLVATNTSCLRVGDLARHMKLPGRFLGLHYFSPAAVNPIVEVVSSELTAPETLSECWDSNFRSSYLSPGAAGQGWGAEAQGCAYPSAAYAQP